MKFTTQQLRSYALTFWEFLSLEWDKLFLTISVNQSINLSACQSIKVASVWQT